MQFKFPKDDTTIMRRPVPNRYRGYFIADRPVELIRSPKGELLVQRVNNTHFLLQFQALSCAQPYPVVPHIAGTRIVLFYMLEGNLTYFMRRGRKIEAKAGSYCRFIFTPHPHSQPVLTLPAGFYASFHVEFSPEYFESLVKETDTRESPAGPARRKSVFGPDIRSLLDAVRHCPREEPSQKIYLDIQVRRLLLHYTGKRKLFSPASIQAVEDMALYIRQHLNEDLSIAQLSARFYLSASTLQRYFLHYYDLPVHRFVLRERMEWARELLQSGETIRRTASETGFDEVASFTRSFTRYFGKPPSFFRRR